MSNKPREWMWEVNGVGGIEKLTGDTFKPHEKIHVIEYSKECKIPVGEKFALVDFIDYESAKADDAKTQKALDHVLELNKTLYEEIACLRSVLSEWESDKSCYTQWIVANQIAEMRTKYSNKESK